MPIATLKHGTFTLQDGTGTPIPVTLSPGPGNFQIADLEAGMVEAIPVYNRGTFLELVEGSQKPVEWSIEILQDGKLVDAATGKPLNAVLKGGTLSAGVTADPGGVVWTMSGTFVITRSGVTSTVTITNSRTKVSVAEDAGGNKLSLSGTAYGTGSTLPVVVT